MRGSSFLAPLFVVLVIVSTADAGIVHYESSFEADGPNKFSWSHKVWSEDSVFCTGGYFEKLDIDQNELDYGEPQVSFDHGSWTSEDGNAELHYMSSHYSGNGLQLSHYFVWGRNLNGYELGDDTPDYVRQCLDEDETTGGGSGTEPVPEPGTLALMGLGAAAAGMAKRRRQKRAAAA